MTSLYTAEQMLEADIKAFKKGTTAGLAAALAMMLRLDESINTNEASHKEAWAIAKKVLAEKITEEGDTDGNDRIMPVLWTDTDSRS